MTAFKHPLLLVILPLVAFFVVASFYRFLVVGEYAVEYEGACDPVTESCFVGCEDEECAEPYYYTQVHKYASDVQAQCGVDFSDCDEANACLPTDRECVITYCDPDTETATESCEHIEGAKLLEEGLEEVIPEEEQAATTTAV